MIRLIFVALFVVLFLIIGIPVLGIEWLIGKVSKKTMDYSSLRLVQWAFKMIIKLAGIELTVIGEENISEGPVLYIGNHRSFFDIVITYARCKNLTGYIAKKEMLSIPLLRTWMKRPHIPKRSEGKIQWANAKNFIFLFLSLTYTKEERCFYRVLKEFFYFCAKK